MMKDKKVLVTGAGGFLGSHLCKRLLAEGAEVYALELTEDALKSLDSLPVKKIVCDLRDKTKIAQACMDKDYVFNPAALVAQWGDRDAFWAVNVAGTDNLIAGCKQGNVKRLIHVSSPSAIFDGKDHYDGDESMPYPKKFLNYYCETKAVSEQRVLRANHKDLETVAIRPHAIWGPGDRHLLPKIIERAKAGRLVQVGDGSNEVSTVYVDNAVEGCIKAATSDKAPGNVYFITDGNSIKLWDFVRRVLNMMNLPKIKREVPFFMVDTIASVMESSWRALSIKKEPFITRYMMAELAKNHTYSIEKARQELGYEPIVTIDEGLKRVKEWADQDLLAS